MFDALDFLAEAHVTKPSRLRPAVRFANCTAHPAQRDATDTPLRVVCRNTWCFCWQSRSARNCTHHRIKGRWEEMDHVAERAPHGWRAEHELTIASDQEVLGFSPMSDSEEVGSTARKSAWARLLARPTPVGGLLRSTRSSAQSVVARMKCSFALAELQ